jgi:hypothetical protein
MSIYYYIMSKMSIHFLKTLSFLDYFCLIGEHYYYMFIYKRVYDY